MARNTDLLNPKYETEKRKHKLKRLIPSPNSYFIDVKCGKCDKITTIFSHAQTHIRCHACAIILAKPTGGLARLAEGLFIIYLHN
ncbi:40S ribosomal protein S27, partial [Intoshia linei]